MELVLGLLTAGALVSFCFALFRKAGYQTGSSVLMAIGILVPFVNLSILIYFVWTTWPIQAELNSLRGKAGIGSEDGAAALMSAALRLECRGDVTAAIRCQVSGDHAQLRRHGGSEGCGGQHP